MSYTNIIELINRQTIKFKDEIIYGDNGVTLRSKDTNSIFIPFTSILLIRTIKE